MFRKLSQFWEKSIFRDSYLELSDEVWRNIFCISFRLYIIVNI